MKLTGVADSSGSAATNAQVSQRRAQTVQDALKAKGADAKYEITAAGTDATVTPDKARRVEIAYVRRVGSRQVLENAFHITSVALISSRRSAELLRQPGRPAMCVRRRR